MGKYTAARGYEKHIAAMRDSMALSEQLRDAAWAQAEKALANKQIRKSYWWQRLASAMSDLRHVDPAGWEAWYDSDAVPEMDTDKNRALLVERHIQALLSGSTYRKSVGKLYRGIFIWTDQKGSFIFREDGKIVEFLGESEAKAHVDAALTLCVTLV